MNKGRVRSDGAIEELLALRVSAKVDGPRRCNTDQIGTETLEQGPGPLILHDMPQTLDEAHAWSQRRRHCHGRGEVASAPERAQGSASAVVGTCYGRTEVAGG
jgi:hypothetical protein